MIFRFLYEQWSQIKVKIEKIDKILDRLIFGSADGPRVRGGRSAVHWTCQQRLCREFVSRKLYWQTVRQWTADGPRVTGASGQLRIHRWCVLWACRGRSAQCPRTVRRCWVKLNRGSFSGEFSRKFSEADGPPGYRGRSAPAQNWWGRAAWLIWGVAFFSPHQTDHFQPKALSLSLLSMRGRLQGQGFLAWFPDGPRASPDILSVFRQISNSCSWISSLERVRVRMLWSDFGPWICEINWGILLLVLRRCCAKNLVSRFALELKLWMNQDLGDFQLLCLNRWVADGPPADRGQFALVFQ